MAVIKPLLLFVFVVILSSYAVPGTKNVAWGILQQFWKFIEGYVHFVGDVALDILQLFVPKAIKPYFKGYVYFIVVYSTLATVYATVASVLVVASLYVVYKAKGKDVKVQAHLKLHDVPYPTTDMLCGICSECRRRQRGYCVRHPLPGSFYVQSPPLSKFTSKFEDLVNLNELIPVLYEAGVLVNEEVEKLIEAVWNNKLKVVYLITIMRGKGKEGLQRLIDCLEKEPNHIGHAELAGILKEAYAEVLKEPEDSSKLSVGGSNTVEQLKLHVKSLEAENEKLKRQLDQNKPKSSCYHIHGIEVVGEVELVLTNEGMNFQWKDHGFKLHIPENSLPEGVSEHSINIKASLAGQFELPNGYELVSAVYWVATPGEFTKPVTIEVQHCANFSNPSQLCFVHCAHKSLPYNFEVIDEGTFALACMYGVLSTTYFSGFAIAKKETPGEHSCQYCAQVYFTVKHLQDCWYCHFVITKDLETCLAVVKRKYNQEYDIAPTITFGDDHVALDISDDGIRTDSGWEVKPLHKAIIKKDEVDSFSSERTRIPECVLLLKWFQKDKVPDLLEYKVKLLGTGDEKDFFLIIHHPESSMRSLHVSWPPVWTLFLALSIASAIAGLWWIAPTHNSNCHTIEDVSAVLDELCPITDWQTLGEELGVPWESLGAIGSNYQRAEHKMRETICKWFSNTERPCWEMVVRALKKLKEKNLANKIAESYGVKYTEL